MMTTRACRNYSGLTTNVNASGRRRGCLVAHRPTRAAIQPCAADELVSTVRESFQESEPTKSPSTSQRATQPSTRSAQRFADVVAAFWRLSSEQKLSLAIGGVILVFLVPKLALVGLAGVERALVGGVIALEMALVSAIRSLLTGALGVGVVGFVLLSTMAFLFPKEKK